MSKSRRLASRLSLPVLVACLALWLTAHAAGPTPLSEDEAFTRLSHVAAAHGATLSPGLRTYAHFGSTVIAHAPLDGIGAYTDADFEAGAPILALTVDAATPGAVPNGTYLLRVRIKPGAAAGQVALVDAAGALVATGKAVVRSADEINGIFPRSYEPLPPLGIPNITSTHVWHNNQWAVDCSGWQPWRVIYFYF